MRKEKITFMLCLLFLACNPNTESNQPKQEDNFEQEVITGEENPVNNNITYSNERIKYVKVEGVSENTYRVTGQAQVFEATLSYVVEDGHYELIKGFTTTDAGAPEFGNFDFTFSVKKREPHTTLMLILFESSAKDGSRQHELVIPLEE